MAIVPATTWRQGEASFALLPISERRDEMCRRKFFDLERWLSLFALLPLALKRESATVKRRLPLFFLPHFDLRLAQGCRWPQTVLEHPTIEAPHQLSSRYVIHLP